MSALYVICSFIPGSNHIRQQPCSVLFLYADCGGDQGGAAGGQGGGDGAGGGGRRWGHGEYQWH